jgi:hypothetical protein
MNKYITLCAEERNIIDAIILDYHSHQQCPDEFSQRIQGNPRPIRTMQISCLPTEMFVQPFLVLFRLAPRDQDAQNITRQALKKRQALLILEPC